MHPEFLSMALFWIVAAYTPGPNNVIASYSGFNFGIKKTLPHIFGVTFGFTSLTFLLIIGLVNVFKIYPIIQTSLKYFGSLFLIYLAYKICFSKSNDEKKKENPVTFLDTFVFQFLNPKGVMAAITLISNFVIEDDYINSSLTVIIVCSLTALTSITSWAFFGKFLRNFATNNNFIKRFNYAMSLLLIFCIIGFYI